jgi:lipopolysaccharide export system protein LptA
MRCTRLVILFLLIALAPAVAQKKVKLKQADKLKGGRLPDGERFERLQGNIIFVQNNTTIYCDSAYFFKKKNSLDAFGHVRIVDGDSITITAKKLSYDGNTKKAMLRNNVVFTKLQQATLYTDFLDFDRPKNEATYFNGGKLVDSINVLTSRKGYYDLNNNMASFKRNVDVKNPDYTMKADSLQYNSKSKVIFFRSSTTVIKKDSSTFVYEAGQYDTKTKRSDLKSGVGENEEYKIVGNTYDLDAIRNIYKVRGDIVMTSKKENMLIYGQASDAYKTRGITKIYNRAYIAKVSDEGDTLFIRADTLVAIDNKDPKKKRLLAYHNVKIFKSDLQGIADSLEYRSADSTIFFYKNPALWTAGNQMTADSISMRIKDNGIDKIFMVANAFVISKDTLQNYNQIKGRKMTASFSNKKISKVVVDGNGESIYHALEEKDNSFIGLNKIICSNITIRFKDGKVQNLSFYIRPEANFIPPHELKEEDRTLRGFIWKENVRPSRNDVVASPQAETSKSIAPKLLKKAKPNN